MQAISKQSNEFLYQQVIELIQQMQRAGTLRAGDKLPSLRKLSTRLGVSVPTVKQAYLELERQGTIAARPQSGYYLKAIQGTVLRSKASEWDKAKPAPIKCESLIERVHEALHTPGIVPLGIANPVMVHPADKLLTRTMRRVLSQKADRAVSYGPINGDPELRRLLAFRYHDHGISVEPDEVVVTNGAQEALSIALQCVAEPGDVIAVESPTYFGILELIASKNMQVIEIRTCTESGICLDDLEEAIDKHPIKACIFSSAVNNPLGTGMGDEKREKMVRLLESHDLPLIEDDVYGELYFGNNQPRPAAFYARKNLVLTCNSFSKTASPGYRIGWLIPGQWEARAKRLKRGQSCSTSMVQQWTLAEFIKSGDYERHLRVMRKNLTYNAERMRAFIYQHFPQGTCVSEPVGGSTLWIKCPNNIDTAQFFDDALAAGLSFTPGSIFSPSGKYHDHLRVSYGIQWDDKIEPALLVLAKLVKEAVAKAGNE